MRAGEDARRSTDRIGARLLAEGIVAPEQLQIALERQRVQGGRIGEHLIDAGYVERRDFYSVLAAQRRLVQRDLVAHPPTPEALAMVPAEECLERGWVPCDAGEDGVLVIATDLPLTDELRAEVAEHLPGHAVRFVACTRRDLDAVALAVAGASDRQRRAAAAAGGRAVRRPRVGVRHQVAAVALLVGLAVASATAPVDATAMVVLLLGGLFLVGVSTQVILGLAHFSQQLDRAAATGRDVGSQPARLSDEDLPVYSVLVRLRGAGAAVDAAELVARLDYPRPRLDVLWLVDTDDEAAIGSLAHTPPSDRVRLVQVAAGGPAADDLHLLDRGLALARGRYAVAFDAADRPAPDQLRRAAERFEDDLSATFGPRRRPLLALRTTLRATATRRTWHERLSAADFSLRIDRGAEHVCIAVAPRDPRGLHVNRRLLQRRGGFSEAALPPLRDTPAADHPRIEELTSVALVRHAPRLADWLDERARAGLHSMPEWSRRVVAGALTVHRPLSERRGAGEALRAAGVPIMYLAFVPLLTGGLAIGIRSTTVHHPMADRVAWLVLGELALVLGAVTMFSSVVLAAHRGQRATVDLLHVPVHWVLASIAFWASALVVLLARAARLRTRVVRLAPRGRRPRGADAGQGAMVPATRDARSRLART